MSERKTWDLAPERFMGELDASILHSIDMLRREVAEALPGWLAQAGIGSEIGGTGTLISARGTRIEVRLVVEVMEPGAAVPAARRA